MYYMVQKIWIGPLKANTHQSASMAKEQQQNAFKKGPATCLMQFMHV